MATRSAIGYKLPNGAIRAVYCHYDGYTENNGRILLDNYKAAFDIARLVELGDMSALGTDTSTMTYYGRDRGETGVEAKEYADYHDYVSNFEMGGVEYWYCWDGNKWLVSKGNGLFNSVERVLAMESVQ